MKNTESILPTVPTAMSTVEPALLDDWTVVARYDSRAQDHRDTLRDRIDALRDRIDTQGK